MDEHEAEARTRTQLAMHKRTAAHHRCRYMSAPVHREQRSSAAVYSWECLQQGQEIFVHELEKKRDQDHEWISKCGNGRGALVIKSMTNKRTAEISGRPLQTPSERQRGLKQINASKVVVRAKYPVKQ